MTDEGKNIHQKGVQHRFFWLSSNSECPHNQTEEYNMALTEFGKAVRMARIQIGETLLTMSGALNVSSSFLSGLETGSKKISKEWVNKINDYLNEKGCSVPNLDELASVSNESVNLEGLSAQQKMLVAGFAKSPFTKDQLTRFAELLEQMNNQGDK